MVEKILTEADLDSEDEIEQIKSSCSKLIDQYEVAFVQNTGANADSSKKSAEEYSELRQQQNDEVQAETQAAFKLAKERGERFKKQLD